MKNLVEHNHIAAVDIQEGDLIIFSATGAAIPTNANVYPFGIAAQGCSAGQAVSFHGFTAGDVVYVRIGSTVAAGDHLCIGSTGSVGKDNATQGTMALPLYACEAVTVSSGTALCKCVIAVGAYKN